MIKERTKVCNTVPCERQTRLGNLEKRTKHGQRNHLSTYLTRRILCSCQVGKGNSLALIPGYELYDIAHLGITL